MSEQKSPHIEISNEIENPITWETTNSFLNLGIAALMVGAIASLIAVRVVTPDQTLRMIGPGLLFLIGATAWYFLSRNKELAAVNVLGYGTWIVAAVVMIFTGGVHAPIAIIFPAIILMVGWLIGVRLAQILAGLTAALIIWVVLAKSEEWLIGYHFSPPALHGVIQITVALLSAIVVTSTVRAYKNRLIELNKLGNELNVRTLGLQANEERLRLALGATNQGWFDVDLRTGNVIVSPEYPRMIGYSPEDFKSDLPTWLANVHPEDRDAITSAFQTCVENGGPETMEYRRQTKTGDWKWIRSIGKIIERNDEGKPTRMIGIHTDINEQKQAEVALRDSELRYRHLADNSPLAIQQLLPDGTTIRVNAAWERLWQTPFPALKDYNVFKDQQLDEMGFLPTLKRAFTGESVEFPEHRYDKARVNEVPNSGGQIWLRAFAYPVHGENGQVQEVVLVQENITERKIAEEELSQTMSLLQATVESTNDAILVVDLNGRWRLHNQKFVDLWQIPKDIIDNGQDAAALVYVADQLEEGYIFLDKVHELYNKPESSSFDRFRFNDGKIVERFSTPYRIDGIVAGRVWSFRDATERIRAEAALQASEERWKFALEGAGDGVWDWNPKTDEALFSKRWKEMIGYAEHEFPNAGTSWREHIHPDDRDRVLSVVNEYFCGNRPFYIVEFQMRCKDGSLKWILARGKLVKRDVDGKPLRMIGTHTDITQIKQVEQDLRKLSIAVEQSPASVVITDLEANIQYVNPRFTETTGYSAEEAIGQNPRILQSKLTPKETHLEMWKNLTSGLPWHGELINKRKNGEDYYEDSHIAPVKNQNGIVTHYVAVKIDVTENKLTQNQLKQVQDEQEAILDSRIVGIVKLEDRKFVWVNDAFAEMFGYTKEEMLGMSTLIMYPTEKAYVEFAEASYPVMRRGEIFRTEIQYLRKDRTIRWYDISGGFLSPENKTSIWAFVDISERMQFENDLLTESKKNLALLRNASDGIHILDLDGKLIEYSDSFCTMLGYTREEMIGIDVSRWDCHFSTNDLPIIIRQQFDQGTRSQFETLHRCKDGTFIDVEISGYPLEINGKPVMFYSSRDITEQKEFVERLRESEKRFRVMADSTPVLIWISGTDKLCNWFNKVWLDFTGRTMEQEMGNGWVEGVHPNDFERCLNTYVTAFDARHEFTMEFRLCNAKGEYRWLLDSGVPRFDDEGNFFGYIGSCIDITDRHQMEAKIQHLAFHDQLTKLPNRRLFNDRLRQAISASKRNGSHLALMLVDLDNFKPLNDSYGHAAGDLLLIDVAKRLKSCIREADTVARFGGDEFVVLLSELTEDKVESSKQAEIVAKKILKELSIPYSLQMQNENIDKEITIEHRCTASIGVAVIVGSEASSKEVLMLADKAMYKAKTSGRNNVQYHET